MRHADRLVFAAAVFAAAGPFVCSDALAEVCDKVNPSWGSASSQLAYSGWAGRMLIWPVVFGVSLAIGAAMRRIGAVRTVAALAGVLAVWGLWPIGEDDQIWLAAIEEGCAVPQSVSRIQGVAYALVAIAGIMLIVRHKNKKKAIEK